LRNIKAEYEITRNKLYNSETARFNEADARMALQRHLRLEQNSHQECAAAYASLQRQHLEMTREIDGLCTFNEILRGEVEHGQRIINSMASKISEYESAAQLLTISPALQRDNPRHQESVIESSTPMCDGRSVVSVTLQTTPQITSAASSQASAHSSPYGGTLVSPHTPQGSLPDLKNDGNISASAIAVDFDQTVRNASIESETGSSERSSGFVTVTPRKKARSSKKRNAL
jgi:hypothetical protein